jgi:hypothetical protein
VNLGKQNPNSLCKITGNHSSLFRLKYFTSDTTGITANSHKNVGKWIKVNGIKRKQWILEMGVQKRPF